MRASNLFLQEQHITSKQDTKTTILLPFTHYFWHTSFLHLLFQFSWLRLATVTLCTIHFVALSEYRGISPRVINKQYKYKYSKISPILSFEIWYIVPHHSTASSKYREITSFCRISQQLTQTICTEKKSSVHCQTTPPNTQTFSIAFWNIKFCITLLFSHYFPSFAVWMVC